MTYDPTKFAQFSDEYRAALLDNVTKNFHEYASGFALDKYPEEYARELAEKMLNSIETKGLHSVNIDSPSFKRACKNLNIKHSRKAIEAFLKG